MAFAVPALVLALALLEDLCSVEVVFGKSSALVRTVFGCFLGLV